MDEKSWTHEGPLPTRDSVVLASEPFKLDRALALKLFSRPIHQGCKEETMKVTLWKVMLGYGHKSCVTHFTSESAANAYANFHRESDECDTSVHKIVDVMFIDGKYYPGEPLQVFESPREKVDFDIRSRLTEVEKRILDFRL